MLEAHNPVLEIPVIRRVGHWSGGPGRCRPELKSANAKLRRLLQFLRRFRGVPTGESPLTLEGQFSPFDFGQRIFFSTDTTRLDVLDSACRPELKSANTNLRRCSNSCVRLKGVATGETGTESLLRPEGQFSPENFGKRFLCLHTRLNPLGF